MSAVEEFLAGMIDRQIEGERAMTNGDAEPRNDTWSQRDPVTLFGAWGPCKSGWDELGPTFRWVASRMSNVKDYRFELVAAGASGDLAYTVAYEHVTTSVDGGPPEPVTLRATHVYRREDGVWRIVHRHADNPPVDQSAGVIADEAG